MHVLMSFDVCERRPCSEERACMNRLLLDVVENMIYEIHQGIFCCHAHLILFVWKDQKNVVIFFSVFNLFHEAEWLTVDDLSCF